MKYPTRDHDMFTCDSGDQIKEERINDTVPDCPFYGDDETWLSDDNLVVINQTISLVYNVFLVIPKYMLTSKYVC